MRRVSRIGTTLVSHPWAIIAVAGFVLFGMWVASTRSQAHHVRAVFGDAVSILPGLDVQVNGTDVGKVSKIEYVDGQAIVRLGIDDDSVWPLRQGTTATIRFGTTVGNGTRKIDLVPGPASAPEIPEDGLIARENAKIPTEFDQVFQTFDVKTREDLKTWQKTMNGSLRGRAQRLGEGVRAAAPAFDAAGGVLGDLAVDQGTLRSLVRTGDAATQTLAARDDQIRGLMTVAAATFDTFATNSRDMEQAIEQFPGTLRQTRSTLGRLDVSLDQLEPLMVDLRPGARQLRPLAAAARPALAQLRKTVPGARDAVHTMRRSAPAVTALLTKGAPFMKKIAPMFQNLSPIAGCLRPYAPELAGFFSNWTSFTQNYDDEAHYARVRVNEGQTSLTDTPAITTDQFIKLAGVRYAGLRPPGFNGGKPMFLPQCGVGQDAVDPAKDWEDGR